MFVTWFSSNTWLIEIAGLRILVDPWLVGPLVFGNLEWLFRGECSDRPIPQNLDLILLSQGLPDHAHPQTLNQLPKNTPVVASVQAAQVVQQLGYTEIYPLKPGQTYVKGDRLVITATAGAWVGPATIENGYILRDLQSPAASLYYEPHGSHDPRLAKTNPVNLVITPTVDLQLPIIGSIIQGSTATKPLNWLRPRFIMPTAAPGDVSYTGLLINLLNNQSHEAALKAVIAQNHPKTQLLVPQPGQQLAIPA